MLKRFMQCVGIASLVLVVNYGEMLGGGADVRMHVPLGLAKICMAQIADILLLGLALFLIVAAARRTRSYPWVKLVLAMLMPPYLVGRIRYLFPGDIFGGYFGVIAIAWAAAILLMRLRSFHWYRRLLRVGSMVCTLFAFFAVSAMLQLLWVAAWKPGVQETHAAWAGGSAEAPRPHPLLVWILFDELSYDQVFEHRARDLNLPYFDALRGESTVFTEVQPVGYYTRKIVPSLLSGQVVADYHYNFSNRFRVKYEGGRGWHALDGSGTVFGDARKLGWRTAAVGWYNPYCSTYGDAIDECYWTNWDKIEGPMAQREGFWRNTYSPLQQLVRETKASARAERDVCTYDVRKRYETHIDLENHALQLLRTDQADFVFLHLAIPHSPNIWSRIEDDYTQFCDSSYLDSLALADRELGKVMRILKTSPRWRDTSVIVQGDHSWRVDTWNGRPTWTEEDDAASKETFDPRPALLIHRAGQEQAETVSKKWPLLGVHDVVERVLRGETVVFP